MGPTDPHSLGETVYTAPHEFDVPEEGFEKIPYEGNKAVIKFSDGSVLVGEDESEEAMYPDRINSQGHGTNLAEFLPEQELNDIGNSLKFAVDEDQESQEQFFESVATAIEYLGLTLSSEDDEEGLPFKGASSVYSCSMHEVILDTLATLKVEIFKSNGMVDTVIMGEASEKEQDIAERKKSFNNYFFDVEAKEFRKEAIRAAYWAILAGFIYKKVYICPVLNRPVSMMIPLRDFIVNREHSSHLAATRKTHILRLSEREYQMRIMMGVYRDVNAMKQDDMTDSTDVIQEQLDQISGYESTRHMHEDAGYVIYEIHADYRIKSDPEAKDHKLSLPYIISVDGKSGKVLSIYRNWDEQNPIKTKKEFFVCYSYLPSMDGEGYGLVNYAGRLAEAATSLTRQLINSGTYSNFPGGVYQSGIRIENNNLRPAPGEFVPIQTGGIPVGQAIEALPYREPSQALHSLKDEIEESIKRPSSIMNKTMADAMPSSHVQSVYAMFENLHRVPNAILQNFYEAFTRELELFNDRFREWIKPGKPYPFMVPGGQHIIMQEDFESEVKVIPSADPSAKNSAHRLMLSEILFDKAMQNPQLHNMEAVYKNLYKNLGLTQDEIDKFLSPKQEEPPQVPPMDIVSTMMALIQGQPVQAAVWQNHDAYIAAIDVWMQQNPQNPNIAAAAALKAQHEAFKYMVDVYSKLGIEPPQDPSQLTPDQQNNLAVDVAHVKVEEAQAAAAAATPPEPPLDPAKVELEAAHLQAQMAHEKHEVEYRRIELDAKKAEMEYFLKEQEFDLKQKIEMLKQQVAHDKEELNSFKVSHEQVLKERDQALKERDSMLEKYGNEMSNNGNVENNNLNPT